MQPLSEAVQYQIARAGQELPVTPGLTWIWASGGIWLRGAAGDTAITIPIGAGPDIPGLARLLPGVQWRGVPGRLPGELLAEVLRHAITVAPKEQQYFVIWRDDDPARPLRVIAPRQQASGTSVRYEMPRGRVLLDIHSHHHMPAFWSATDNADDTGLSVSIVIGRVTHRPELRCRLNVWGWHHPIAARTILTHSAGFRDLEEEQGNA